MENQHDKNTLLLDYTFVLDASGSMSSDSKEVLGELNQQLQTLKDKYAETRRPCRVSIVKFNTDYRMLRDNEPIETVALVEREEYIPGGMTALYDSFGISVAKADARVGFQVGTGEAEALVVVFTDGLENASREYSGQQVSSIFKDYQQRPGWEIILVGTDFTSLEDMAQRNMRRDKMRHYDQDEKRRAMANLRSSVRDYYTQEDREFNLDKEADLEEPNGPQN
ncbi:MAG: hypothetical protein RLY31_1026 [Bacteroidota bacterium]|jgi:uncharacterized protein YegL